MRYKLVKGVGLFFALLVLCCALLGASATRTVRLRLDGLSLGAGERTYYLYSASSQAKIKKHISLRERAFLQGESVEYSLLTGTDGEELAYSILKELGGELLFTEYACGVRSYYAYAPDLYNAVGIKDTRVNLHVAVKDGRIAVGSPLIFGGY